jgi:hypothetical protein
MITIIDYQKIKASTARARLKLAAANAGAVLEQSPYAFQPGARQLLPMLAELKDMRRHLAVDWPAATRHDLNYLVDDGRCTQAEADQDHAEVCRRIGLRVAEFDKAIAGIQALLDLGSPTG